MPRYAIIEHNKVSNVAMADSPMDANWIQSDTAMVGWVESNGVLSAPVIAPAVVTTTRCTKRAFQNRFPLTADGVSTKWDVMTLFLSSDSYSTSIGVTGEAMHALRLMVQTGLNRMNASQYVDLAPGQEAEQFTLLLIQPGIPTQFALTSTERTGMLTTPLLDSEIYKG